MNSTITYSGEVTVYTKHKNKIVRKNVTHNTGKAPLFNFLVDCLAGDWSSNGVPKYLGIYNKTGTVVETLHYQLTPVSSIQKNIAASGGTSASIEFTFLVSGANIQQGEEEGNLLRLFNSDNLGGLNESAEVILETPLQGTTVAAGISYLVIWKMTLADTAASE